MVSAGINFFNYAANSTVFAKLDVIYIRTLAAPTINSYVPAQYGGKDRADWVLLIGLFVLFSFLGAIKVRLKRNLSRREVRKATEQWKNKMHVPAKSRIATDLEAKIDKLQKGKGVDHQELLKIFAETKRKLDSLARDLSFLSVDVVGSTQMKESEEPAAIQHDFHAYRQLVEGGVQAASCIESNLDAGWRHGVF